MMPVGGILDRYISAGFLRIFGISLAVVTGTLRNRRLPRTDRQSARIRRAGFNHFTLFHVQSALADFSGGRIRNIVLDIAVFGLTGTLSGNHRNSLKWRQRSTNRPAAAANGALCLSGITFFWNETLVPIFSRNAQQIYRTEIRQKRQLSLFGTRDIWIRGDGSFINIDNFDPRTNTLNGVTVFTLNRDFSLRSLIQIPSAQWNIRNWQTDGAVEWELQQDGKLTGRDSIANIPITETPDDLKLLARDAEEYSYFDLQKQIGDMKTKGIDTTAIEVDLHGKLAIPVVSLLMVLLATPFAIKRNEQQHLAQFWNCYGHSLRLLGPYSFLHLLGPQRRHSSATGRMDSKPNFFDDRAILLHR